MNHLFFISIGITLIFSTVEASQEKLINRLLQKVQNLQFPLPQKLTLNKKNEILKIIHSLNNDESVQLIGHHKDTIELAELFKALFEESLSEELKKNISLLASISLTSSPPTMFNYINEIGTIKDNLNNNSSEFTLSNRSKAMIFQNYLARGGVFYLVGAKNSIESFSTDQMQAFLKLNHEFPNNFLFKELNTQTIDSRLTGTIFFYTTSDSKTYAFIIKASDDFIEGNQQLPFELYLGGVDNPLIKKVMNEFMNFINDNSI
jgi:hypothetical protein